jgi:hypothetical protein
LEKITDLLSTNPFGFLRLTPPEVELLLFEEVSIALAIFELLPLTLHANTRGGRKVIRGLGFMICTQPV